MIVNVLDQVTSRLEAWRREGDRFMATFTVRNASTAAMDESLTITATKDSEFLLFDLA